MHVPPTPRTRVRRHPERGVYDPTTIRAILDEGTVAHLGFVADGQPWVVPLVYGRHGGTLYLHGSAASRATATAGTPVCATVTLLDGLVLARSAFHHSVNYRSVVVVGVPREVADDAERLIAARAIVEHVAPGRWEAVREPDARELARTRFLALGLEEASAKVRTGPPVDDPDDLDREVWAGVVELSTHRREVPA